MLSRAHRGKSLPSPTVTACRESKLLRAVPRESYSMAFFLNPSITRVLSTADGCGGTKANGILVGRLAARVGEQPEPWSIKPVRRTKFSDELVVDPPMQATASSNAGVSA
jgi:hypothetical protein